MKVALFSIVSLTIFIILNSKIKSHAVKMYARLFCSLFLQAYNTLCLPVDEI